MDVKKLGMIPDGGGWRAHGRGAGSIQRDRTTNVGYDYVHSLVDDHSRLTYSEVLPDEKGPTCAAFLERAITYFAVHGITRIERLMWAYRQVFTSNDERAAALAPWLEHYNTERRHSALGGKPPISRLLPT